MDPMTLAILGGSAIISADKAARDREEAWRARQLAAQLGTLSPYGNTWEELRKAYMSRGITPVQSDIAALLSGLQGGAGLARGVSEAQVSGSIYDSLLKRKTGANDVIDEMIAEGVEGVSDEFTMPEIKFKREKPRYKLSGGV